ncbi:MAG: FlgD immunoglobulin-like domain containing protein [Candidatus Eisenbacteria bacterium]
MIWLACLLSAALLSVSGKFPTLAASDADAATTLNCAVKSCGTGATQDFSYSPPSNSWAVVGARSTATTGDARICLYADAAYTQQRACSNASAGFGGVEFTVMDFHHSPAVTNYARTERLSGSGEVCTQLDCGATTITVDAAPIVPSWTAGDVVRIYNVPVVAGQTYRADISTSGLTPTADFGLAVFDSHGQANYAAGRTSAIALADRRASAQGEGVYFEATATDTLGLVVWVNNAAGSGSYRLEVRTVTRIQPNTPVTYSGTSQRDFFTIPSAPRGWSVLSLRPGSGSPAPDADLRLYDSPDYLGLLGKSSAEAGVVDFIVADYANAPEDTGAVLMISLGPLGTYRLEWTEHPPVLLAGADDALDLGTAGHVGVGRVVSLSAGVEYQFLFDPADGTRGDAALGLYGPRATKPVFTYGTRADSIAGSDAFAESPTGWASGDGVETFFVTPALTGSYLLYVYQKRTQGVVGSLRFFPTTLLGTPPWPSARVPVALATPWPSPAHGAATIHLRCDLERAEPQARLVIHDLRGRAVRRVLDGPLAAGTTVLSWDGRDESGFIAPPGLYFARLSTSRGSASRPIAWLR